MQGPSCAQRKIGLYRLSRFESRLASRQIRELVTKIAGCHSHVLRPLPCPNERILATGSGVFEACQTDARSGLLPNVDRDDLVNASCIPATLLRSTITTDCSVPDPLGRASCCTRTMAAVRPKEVLSRPSITFDEDQVRIIALLFLLARRFSTTAASHWTLVRTLCTTMIPKVIVRSTPHARHLNVPCPIISIVASSNEYPLNTVPKTQYAHTWLKPTPRHEGILRSININFKSCRSIIPVVVWKHSSLSRVRLVTKPLSLALGTLLDCWFHDESEILLAMGPGKTASWSFR